MALFSVNGPPGDFCRSFQYAFTTHPRTAAPTYGAGGWASRSSSPWSTGLSGPLGAVLTGDEGIVGRSGTDGHVPRRWHFAACRAARRASRSAWRSDADV